MKLLRWFDGDTIRSQIKSAGNVTFHEVDCYADFHFENIKRCVINDTELSVVGKDDGWFTIDVQAILEISFADQLTVIVYDQNLLCKKRGH